MGLTGRFMKKSIDAEDDAIIFDDECFVLPDSLKASHLKKTLGRKGQKKIFETAESEEDGSEARRGKENDKTETKRGARNEDDSLIIGTFGAGEALRYLVNYDGRYHKVLNDQLVSERDRLLVRTTSDYEVNEVFTRRADGTDTLVCSNEELIVIFSGVCAHNGLRDIRVTLHRQYSYSRCACVKIRSCRTSDAKRNQTVSIADGFVTILLTLRVKHKDYAALSCDQSAVSCTLSMPDNLRVSISRRGHYEVSIGDKVNLKTRVTSDKRTDYDRIELSRSTYSFPYNWLFPFGKKVVAERTRNEVLAKRNEQSLHKLLRVRVFFGIKGAKRSVLIDMQRAMGRYWISVLRDSDKCRLFYATGSRSRPYEVENNYESSQDGLRELAVGVKESIDVETYVRSLQGKLIKVSTKASRQSSRLAELLRQRRSMKEEYEWYKQCMRKRIIVPYFRNIADSRYFLMKNHVDGATSKRSYLRVVAEKRRSR
ncbi:LOW QUALITY PROTEIN: uncharacterized protein [Cardiocondyla obscurior]|uniref:LOW QUALITY PROTEIN: uncharacterized protein n=1 Tax=Cardiocondyla obscurior TaxID=286306 RepID=UPI0039657E53